MARATLVMLTALLLVACEPPTPRAKVQEPFPADAPVTPPAPAETPDPDAPATRESLVATVPAAVDEVEARHRALLEQLTETEAAILALEGELKLATEPDHHAQLQERAEELRAAARSLAAEARGLKEAADELRETSTMLKALGGAGDP